GRSSMPRPPGFNADVVLDRAMLLFWTHGYAATSLQDLVDGTELLRGSLYHTFGDKRSLYIQSLQRYARVALQQTSEQWDPAASALGNVRALLMAIVDLPEVAKRRGSMLCNCIAEVVPHDPEVAHIVEGMLEEFKQLFASLLSRAQHAGEI